MNPLSVDCSTLRRFIVEHLGVPSAIVPAVSFIITCLAVSAALVNSSCVSPTPGTPTSTPTPHRRPTKALSEIPTSTATPIPTSSPLPPVTLEDPEDGLILECGSEVMLHWSSPYDMQHNEYYRLEVQAPGQDDSSFYYGTENYHSLTDLETGNYKWSVAIVRLASGSEYVPVSEESNRYRFQIVPPIPVVRSISPTSTTQGTSVSVVVSGENFTRPLTLTIGVPLQATLVNSSTITATIPITLVVGQYPVIVKHWTGEGASFASFAVNQPPLRTPIPPGYSPPVLAGVDIHGDAVTFHWSWDGQLAEDEYFALRVGFGVPGESIAWIKETTYSWQFRKAGEYAWEIAICRGDPSTHICEQLAVSDPGFFSLGG